MELEKWQQGELLDTPETLKWTEETRQKEAIYEKRLICKNFDYSDQGRSRVSIAICGTPSQAAILVKEHNEVIDYAEKTIAALGDENKKLKDNLEEWRSFARMLMSKG